MGRMTATTTIMAVALILLAQTAMAGTKVFVNLGVPAMHFEYRGGGACDGSFRVEGSYYPECVMPYPHRVYVEPEVVLQPQFIWIEGCYRHEKSHRVWVPGHWHKVYRHHPVMYAPRYEHGRHHQQQGLDRNGDKNRGRYDNDRQMRNDRRWDKRN